MPRGVKVTVPDAGVFCGVTYVLYTVIRTVTVPPQFKGVSEEPNPSAVNSLNTVTSTTYW